MFSFLTFILSIVSVCRAKLSFINFSFYSSKWSHWRLATGILSTSGAITFTGSSSAGIVVDECASSICFLIHFRCLPAGAVMPFLSLGVGEETFSVTIESQRTARGDKRASGLAGPSGLPLTLAAEATVSLAMLWAPAAGFDDGFTTVGAWCSMSVGRLVDLCIDGHLGSPCWLRQRRGRSNW